MPLLIERIAIRAKGGLEHHVITKRPGGESFTIGVQEIPGVLGISRRDLGKYPPPDVLIIDEVTGRREMHYSDQALLEMAQQIPGLGIHMDLETRRVELIVPQRCRTVLDIDWKSYASSGSVVRTAMVATTPPFNRPGLN